MVILTGPANCYATHMKASILFIGNDVAHEYCITYEYVETILTVFSGFFLLTQYLQQESSFQFHKLVDDRNGLLSITIHPLSLSYL